jgi:hypothetical protein
MKANVFVLCVVVLLICTSCNQPTDGTTAQKIAALEAKVETLEKRNKDLEFKGRMAGSSYPFGSPLENFFNSDEFWENPYDSGQADCAKRCVSTLLSERKVCEGITDCTQRQQCFQDVVGRASRCQTNCSASNPPPIP